MRKRNLLAIAAVVAALAVALIVDAQSPQLPNMQRTRFPKDDAAEAMFLVLFGEKTGHPQDWSGEVAVTNGELENLHAYKLEPDDRLEPPNRWRIARRPLKPARSESIYFPGGYQGEAGAGVIATVIAKPGCEVRLNTTRGNFAFRPETLAPATRLVLPEGDASVTRLPVARNIGSTWWNDDYPSIAAAKDGSLWVAWTGFHNERDEVGLRQYKNGQWSNYLPVPGNQGDVWWPQVAMDAKDHPWVVFAQQDNSNWDLYAVGYDPVANEWSAVEQITDQALADTNHQVAVNSAGDLYVTWQALRGKHYDILLRVRHNGAWSRTYVVTDAEGNDWEPSIALDSTGRAWIAWDSYRNGNYDVFLRSFKDGRFSDEISVAATPRLDKRASVVVDRTDRVWVAWEQGDANWGKDLGFTDPKGGGASLGGRRWLRVAVYANGRWMAPEQQPDDAAIVGSGSFQPRLFLDGSGNVGILLNRRMHRWERPQAWWEQQIMVMQGSRWKTPVPLPLSWSRPDTRGDVAVAADGTLWTVYATDGREYAFPHRPLRSEIYAARMPSWPAVEPALAERAADTVTAAPVHPDESGDLKAIHAYRATIAGREARIVRGDTHRHTDMSWDGGGTTDGTFFEFWRYMIDAAAMDWGNVSDHQGGGTYMDYYWWIQAKLADMYHIPGRYTPLFGYERGMLYPDGHRNVVSAKRSLRVLPFLRKVVFGNERAPAEVPPGGGNHAANDVKYLYKYLHRNGAIAISHTSGTGMGTDWRDNDPAVEPVVEIFQGARTSYEQIGAPRAVQSDKPRLQEAPGGFEPAGYVNNAWAKGYRLGVIASSDHNSTHISYALVYTSDDSRQGVIDAIKRRQTYAATDNIILDFRMGDHFMGSEIDSAQAAPIKIYVRGTKPIANIRILRNQQVIYSSGPQPRETRLTYLDKAAGPGGKYYYVRVEQADGELAWSSPIWLK
ncbi:MAG: hypothetical protein HYZ57_10730 [Acidobacteria bacterium]|nr:hypothetical protein [Acidobacteriota bacterium]